MKTLERKFSQYDFGSRLRGWENPDFISRALSGETDNDNINRKLITGDYKFYQIGTCTESECNGHIKF